jgi:ubiquinone/menaquinone biosynthesis C-methylase UbiE
VIGSYAPKAKDGRYVIARDDTAIADRYDSSRRMPEATMRVWLEAIAARVPVVQVDTVIDVGCGTARFSAEIPDLFGARAIAQLNLDLARIKRLERLLRQIEIRIAKH